MTSFLTVQRSTLAGGKIYHELFAKSRTEFTSELSNLCSVTELRCVRDMVLASVKRKLSQNHLGPLIERKSGANVKENLLKDIFNVYSLGEGSIQSLPKNMVRSETRYVSQEVQTNSSLSRMLFTSKSEIEDLKTDLLDKISELREESFATFQHNPRFFYYYSFPFNFIYETYSNVSFPTGISHPLLPRSSLDLLILGMKLM